MANISVQQKQGASGIDVNTTPVTNGATGRVFFQKSDATVGQDERFTYDAALKRLTLRAGGALSTDVAFNVRNSANTENLFEVNGAGQARIFAPLYPEMRFVNSLGQQAWFQMYASIMECYGTSFAIFNGLQLTAQFSTSGMFLSSGRNFTFTTDVGTKIATATNQKLAFWDKTPITQPTTAVSGSTYVHNISSAVHTDDTFDGYTIGQVVKALRNIGLLA